MNVRLPIFTCFVFVAGIHAATPRLVSLSDLPVRFERAADGDYTARGPGYAIVLGRSENRLVFGATQIRTRLIGGTKVRTLEGLDPAPGITNYFIGAEQEWRTDVTAYQSVRYQGVYPGIDMLFHGARKRLEYDFIVEPGADPRRIALAVEGARHLALAESGDLIVTTGDGEVCWKRPEVYQEIDGRRRAVAGRFRLDGRNKVRFAVGDYDRSKTLVIDPVVTFATYFGNTNNEAGRGVALDSSGNIYIAGYTTSANLPVSANAAQPAYGGNTASYQTGDAFVAKFSPSGSLIAMTFLGGSKDDLASAITLDSAGNVYVTGYSNSTNFPVTSNAYQKNMAGEGGNTLFTIGDAFITKLNSNLSQLVYSTYLGGSADEAGIAIAVDASGNAYVTGMTLSTNFPVTAGVVQPAFKGSGGQPATDFGVPFFITGDLFISKLSPDGSTLLFSTYYGGSLDDAPSAIAVDSSGNVYVAGFTISSDFPVTHNAAQTTYGGYEQQNLFYHLGDGFIVKLNPTATSVVYSTYLGGGGDDAVTAIAVDSSGDVYATGATTSTNFPVTAGVVGQRYSGPFSDPEAERIVGDAFVVKLKPDGSGLIYGTYLGGNQDDHANAIAIDSAGNVFIGGATASGNFPVAGPTQSSYAGGGGEHNNGDEMGDGFVAVLNSTATTEIFGTFLGGSMDDSVEGLTIDASDNIVVTGVTMSPDFPVTSAAYQPHYGGASSIGRVYGDAFVAKFTAPAIGPAISSVGNAFGTSTTLAPNTWVAIKGSGLAPDMREWESSDFVNNQLPTALDGVSVLMNNEKAYVYYISGIQINALTPPDLATGAVQVQVINGSASTNTVTVQAQPTSLSLFVFDAAGHVVAQHVPGFTDVGPTTLFPGLTTPAQPGAEVALYGNGFGSTTVPVVAGSLTQSGTLTGSVTAQVNGQSAQVIFSGLVAPGLYQFNLILPSSGLLNGDNPIVITYNGQPTQTGAVITIQQ